KWARHSPMLSSWLKTGIMMLMRVLYSTSCEFDPVRHLKGFQDRKIELKILAICHVRPDIDTVLVVYYIPQSHTTCKFYVPVVIFKIKDVAYRSKWNNEKTSPNRHTQFRLES